MEMKVNLIRSDLMLQKGFTLIEIVVFIVVLGFLAGVLIPFTVSLSRSSEPTFSQQAVTLAQAELEHAVGRRRAGGFAAIIPVGLNNACVTAMLANFTCLRDICYVPAGNLNDTSACATVTNYKRVEVTISHAAIGSVTAVTLFTNQ